jgi:hypothetical protein
VTAQRGLDGPEKAERPWTADLPEARTGADLRVLVPAHDPALEPSVAQALLELIKVLAQSEAQGGQGDVRTPLEEM